MFFRKSKAAVNDNQADQPEVVGPDDGACPTIVAPGTVFIGNIDSEGDILVDGRVRGHVRAGSLTVSGDGTIEGETSADVIVVQGHVKGPVRARHVHLLSGALVEGNVSCATIAIDSGAQLSGTVRQELPAAADDDVFLPEHEPPGFGQLLRDSRQADTARPIATVRPHSIGRSA
jgi:cytoskeletal protein CcmA (bactofilin family)